jgi:DNA-directed RNA polymerase subunit K/omega
MNSSEPASFEIKSVESMNFKNKKSSTQIKKTSSLITKYEYVRLIQARALLIEHGAPVLIEIDDVYEPTEIARRELHARVTPLVIVRTLTNGSVEIWHIKDMSIRDY